MSVNIDAKSVFDFVKELPYRFLLLLIAIISALLIFLPDNLLEKMFLLDLRNNIGTFLGILFIFSTCLTVFLFISPIVKDIRIKKELSGKRAKERISSLSITEKQIIVYMYNHREAHILLPSTNSFIVHLKNQLMISEASNLGSSLGTVHLFPYFLQQWVVQAIDNNPDLIFGISGRLPVEFEKYRQYMDF